MIRRVLFAVFVCGLGLLSASRPAAAFTEAGEAYAYPTFAELTQVTIMLGGMDVRDSRVLDDYIKLMYCDLYRDNYKSDFSFHALEHQILSRISTRKEYFRSLFQVGGVIGIGQYDFGGQQFPLTKGTAFQNVGYMALFSLEDFKPYCPITNPETGAVSAETGIFPKTINIVLSEPFTFTGLKVSPKEAETILGLMQKMGIDKDRKLFIRFRFRVQSVADTKRNKNGAYYQTDLSGEIISIDLFYDKEMTKLVANVPLH